MRLFTWFAGFLTEGTPQSSTRVCMYACTAAGIIYAFRPSPEPEILFILLGAGAAFGGIKLTKDIRSTKSVTTTAAIAPSPE